MSDLQHPGARGFELVADEYERARPTYPPALVAWLAERLELAPGRTVLDLGAGTGKLTRLLVGTGARVLALEPGEEMRARLAAVVPEAEPFAAGAEAIPLPDASVDAATAAQSFHWFRFDEAVPEVHRVLRRGGGLALIWNERDPEDAIQQEVTELLLSLNPTWRRSVARRGWREAIDGSGLFTAFDERTLRFTEELDADGLVARIGTISFVAMAPESERRRLEDGLRTLAERCDGAVPFAYLTQAFVTFSVG
jgi:SAM-dependent methyltransferase